MTSSRNLDPADSSSLTMFRRKLSIPDKDIFCEGLAEKEESKQWSAVRFVFVHYDKFDEKWDEWIPVCRGYSTEHTLIIPEQPPEVGKYIVVSRKVS